MTVHPAHTPDPRIADITLDSGFTAARNADIDIERHKAVTDLLTASHFKLHDPVATGPYKLRLSQQDDAIIMDILCLTTGYAAGIDLPRAVLGADMQEYVILCENFYKTARTGQIQRLEAIDKDRRIIHDRAVETLQNTLQNKVTLDKSTARRLFILLYVLHMRNPTNIWADTTPRNQD